MSQPAPPDMISQAEIRVLHIDDDIDFAEVTGEFLEREDGRFTVQTASSASEALDYLAENDVDCVVSDYDMPGQDGIEFLETVRERRPNLPFILYTGKGSEEIASEAISAGVTDYLQKESGTSQYTVLANRITNAVEQRHSREAVEETERILSELAEKADDVLFMFNEDWSDLLFVNSAYEEIWDRSIEELRSNPISFLDHVHPEDREKARRSAERLTQGEASEVEYRIQTPDGDERWIRGESKPIFDTDGNVVRIVGFARDITEQKERERELKERNQELKEREEQFKVLHSAGERLMQATSREEAAKIAVDSAKNILGYTRATLRLVDENETMLRVVATTEENVAAAGKRPDYRVDEDIPAARSYRRQEPEVYGDLDDTQDEYDRGVLRSGLYVPISNHGVFSCGNPEPNVYDETDVSFLEVLMNLTAAVLTRIASERKLRQKNERLDKFASIVSHDLRNPLEVAMRRVELARDECDTVHLDQAATAHDRIATIIENTLTLSRLGKTVEDKQDIDLTELVHQCWEVVESGTATLVPPQASIRIRADPDRLQQIFENLFRNAVEHGGEDVTISVDRIEDGFAVADDGPGLPNDVDIFEPGVTTSDDGTGFGLTIIQEIVNAHDWAIHATESDGGGARFEIVGVEFAAE